MRIFDLLKNNKGTVSSALGKELAQKVLDGDESILHEAIELSVYDSENKKEKAIRAGAAKTIEMVAEKNPGLVAPHLVKLLPALEVDEPQTRWMIIRTMGFCAELNEETAGRAIKYAKEYVEKKDGLCITSSAELFLGDFGAISKRNAKQVFPILEKSLENVMKNESDWILEAFIKIFKNLEPEEQEISLSFASIHAGSDRKSTQKRAMNILRQAKKLVEDSNS